MKVTLIAHTPEAEKTIAAAAKMCYSDSNAETLLNGLDEEKTARFINMLADLGHESPIEHASFTFGIEGVSRTFLAQFTRHRIASFSVQSQRYVKQDNFVFITTPAIASNPEASAIYQQSMQNSIDDYRKLTDILSKKYTDEFIEQGMDKKTAASKAEKKAIEDARFVLPNACETKMVATFNARSLMNFFRLRCCNRAQWEIHAVADEMLRLCSQVAPSLFKNAGPSCVSCGKCSESKMSCGKMKETIEYYRELKGIEAR